ncbi:autophagy protein [Komagataella kurtzmanii]|nr:autophagy protein [Komagataella kurtzmanii]
MSQPTDEADKSTGNTQVTHESINFANFNQDSTCVSVGYQSGYKIFNVEPFTKCLSLADTSIGIVEMLFSSSLVAIVGLGELPDSSPRKLKVFNTKRRSIICELTFPTSILAVKMNRERMVVLLEDTIYIYDINTMRILHTIETPSNPEGLIALSSSTENNILAYPSPPKLPNRQETSTKGTTNDNDRSHLENIPENVNANSSNLRNGDVIIFNSHTLQPISVIEAHKAQLSAIALSSDGTLLATASNKGTIVRVFDVETGVKLYQFRRGTYPTKIYCLSFSQDNRFVCASSATETVHIFRLGQDEANNTMPSRWSKNQKLALQRYKQSMKQKQGSKPSSLVDSDSDPDVDELVENDNSDDDELEEDIDDELAEERFNSSLTVPRRVSSTTSIGSYGSQESIGDKIEPHVDSARRSVARMIRRTSQSLGRKAAEKMGPYLHPKFSSLLEPNRHFASLKVPASKDTKTVVAIGNSVGQGELLQLGEHEDVDNSSSTSDSTFHQKLLHVMVVSSEGFFYNFGLDTERGGDCTLLSQYSLLTDVNDG